MTAPLLDQRDLEFMLYELFDAESLTSRERYADHNRETFDAAIGTSRTVAQKYFLDYVRERPQVRLPSSKDPLPPPVNIIEGADMRRMLLAHELLDMDGTTYEMSPDWFQISASDPVL